MTEQEANWRYAKFYIYVPSPISIPTDYAFISTDFDPQFSREHRRDWLDELIPDDLIDKIVAEPSCFVVLQFHRIMAERMPWIKYYLIQNLFGRNGVSNTRCEGFHQTT
jgi:hypothetical protein